MTVLKQVQHSRVIGVEIDENLSWNKHIENVVKKVTSGIGLCEESVILLTGKLCLLFIMP
jgi:hypothetical protein